MTIDIDLFSQERAGKNAFYNVLERVRRFLRSDIYMLAQFIAASLFFIFGKEVAGVIFFIYLISFTLIVSKDTMPTFLQFLLIGLIVLRLYDSSGLFMPLKWLLAIPAVVGLVFHFAVYRVSWKTGRQFWGFAAVSAALLAGGLFSISPKDYFAGTSLYYMLGLGVGMLAVYIVLLSYVNPDKQYDTKEFLCRVMLYVGGFTVVMIATQYIDNSDILNNGADFVQDKLSAMGNNLSTTVLLSMPFAFYQSTKPNKYGAAFFLLGYAEFLAAILSLSRGGMIFAAIMLVVCVSVTLVRDKDRRKRNFIVLCIAVLMTAAAGTAFSGTLAGIFSGGIVNDSLKTQIMLVALLVCGIGAALYFTYLFTLDKSKRKPHIIFILCAAFLCAVTVFAVWDKIKDFMIELDSYRGGMMDIAINNFYKYPFFGTGIGYTGLREVYENKTGMFGCYHCAPVQIFASMGLVGVAAYIYMFKTRLGIIAAKKDGFHMTVFLCYMGFLFMSLVNPGMFCPLVYGLQVTLYFSVLEKDNGSDKPIQNSKKLPIDKNTVKAVE